jgi:hypothetical protein
MDIVFVCSPLNTASAICVNHLAACVADLKLICFNNTVHHAINNVIQATQLLNQWSSAI